MLFNVAGLVFFIGFLNLKGHIKDLRSERNLMAHNLSTITKNLGTSESLPSSRAEIRNFISHVDGERDSYAIMPPLVQAHNNAFTLVVYMHGMGSNFLEPFYYPDGEPIADGITSTNPNIVLLSVSYRGQASWGSDTAMSDVSQNIRQVIQEFPIKQIVLVGTSMGGCTVLTYAACAPQDIKDKIIGVVSSESSGDLTSLYYKSKHPALKPALIAAFGGTPEQTPLNYKKKSFLDMVNMFPTKARVAVISARSDTIVPPQMQRDIVAALESQHIAAKLIEVDGDHGAPPAALYKEGVDFVLSPSTN